MKYTIRKIPESLHAALRQRAKRNQKTINEIAVEALSRGLGLTIEPALRRSFRDLLGARTTDVRFTAVLVDQRGIDPALWRPRR